MVSTDLNVNITEFSEYPEIKDKKYCNNTFAYKSFTGKSVKDDSFLNFTFNSNVYTDTQFDRILIKDSKMNNDLFINSHFVGSKIKKTIVQYTNFHNIQFYSCDLSGSSFTDCIFDRCEFINCNLSMCDFTDTIFKNFLRFIDCDITGIIHNDTSLTLMYQCLYDDCKKIDNCILNSYCLFLLNEVQLLGLDSHINIRQKHVDNMMFILDKILENGGSSDLVNNIKSFLNNIKK